MFLLSLFGEFFAYEKTSTMLQLKQKKLFITKSICIKLSLEKYLCIMYEGEYATKSSYW